MDWSVYVQAGGPADAPLLDEAAIDRFAANLSDYSPAVTGVGARSRSGSGRCSSP